MYKNAIVVDKNGIKTSITYVLVDSKTGHILGRELKVGESLIYDYISTALSMVKPRWSGFSWEETATQRRLPPRCWSHNLMSLRKRSSLAPTSTI